MACGLFSPVTSAALTTAPMFGSLTVAVFDNVPLAAGLMVAWTVYVIVLPAGKVTAVSSMLPLPLAVNPVAPPVATAVYVAPVSALGSVSTTEAPLALLGPALVTTTV